MVSQQGTPKRKKSDILASPTHRKITPTSIGDMLHGAAAASGKRPRSGSKNGINKTEEQVY